MPIRPYVSLVGGFAKYLTKVHSTSCNVIGLDRFLQLLADEERKKDGRGVLTYANHISVIDDPGVFGCMPWWTFQRPDTTRWTLGASDILFTNPLFNRLFNKGQVISTDRGRGIFQPALDRAIAKLEEGQWVHLFPEGYVNLSRTMVLRRFKWGMSRLLLESEQRPKVVPIWIEGFDQMMPDPRGFPGFLPRPFANLTIHFGEPIDRLGSALDVLLDSLRSRPSLNPLGWQREQEAVALGRDSKQQIAADEAPSIPIPPAATFPSVSVPAPTTGWAPPPPGSRAAEAKEATMKDECAAMEARSRLVEVLRRELAWLGVRSRRERGEAEGDVGKLVHTLMPEKIEEKSR